MAFFTAQLNGHRANVLLYRAHTSVHDVEGTAVTAQYCRVFPSPRIGAAGPVARCRQRGVGCLPATAGPGFV